MQFSVCFAMLIKRSHSAVLAACSFGALFSASVSASSHPATSDTAFSAVPAAAARAQQSAKAEKDRKAIQRAKTEKARLAEKNAQRTIVTYNLFHDPVFKLNGAVADKRQFIAPRRPGMGPAYPAMVNPLPGAANKAALGALIKEEADSAGTAFGCRERPFRTPSAKRELSACFALQIDKSWKTQTYVTKGYAEGSQTWGGGLALGYHY